MTLTELVTKLANAGMDAGQAECRIGGALVGALERATDADGLSLGIVNVHIDELPAIARSSWREWAGNALNTVNPNVASWTIDFAPVQAEPIGGAE